MRRTPAGHLGGDPAPSLTRLDPATVPTTQPTAVVLLLHGGRTHVVGVVALAPWWDRSEPVSGLPGRHLHAAHGRTDRITSARMTRDYVRRAGPVAASTTFDDMGLVGHYMLHRVASWNDVAATAALGMVEDRVAR